MFLLAVKPFDISNLVKRTDTKEMFELFTNMLQKTFTKPAKKVCLEN